MTPIDVRPADLDTVRCILREQVPDLEVHAFGSRVAWNARETSDLDLALMTAEPLGIDRTARLRAAFTDSDLPFRVDIVDWATASESFRQRILENHVALCADRAEWPIRRFEELLDEPVRNGIYKTKEHHGHGVKIVNMGEIFAHPRLHAVPMRRVALSESEIERFAIKKGDLLFARRSLVAEGAGKCCVVLDVDEPTAFESSIIRARPAATQSDPLYLYYFFCSPSGLHCLDTIRRQVAVAGITGRDLSELEVPAPPLPEQRAIAHILGTLDDKIELNRRMNATLEAMMRALFKSWFVDFGPVWAKMEGRETGLPKDTADLFPDRLVESELGGIPEGWTVGTLGDIATSPRKGIDPKTVDESTPYLGLEHIPRRCVALADWGTAGSVASNKSSFEKGDILFGKLRPYFHKVGIAPVNGICSTDILVLKPRTPRWSMFVLACTSSAEFVNYTSQTAIGTKMPRTSWQIMSGYELCQPTDVLAREFQQVVTPMVERIVSNVLESRLLGVLREALLSKLVSGELRVNEIENPCAYEDSPAADGVHEG